MSQETPSIATEVQVMFFDTDCAGVVHNLAYLRFIETARTLLADQMGLGYNAMASAQQYPVVVRIEVDYKRPAKLWDKLRIEGRLERLERSRFQFAFNVIRPADNTLHVTSLQTCALVQMPAGKPMRIPEDWLTRYGHLRK